MKVYHNDFSPNSKRISVIAKECGVTMEVVNIDFAKGAHKEPAYMKKNPNGKVPTFEDADGTVIWESPAVLVYFAEKHPQKGLLPNDPVGRAEVFKWMFWNAAHLEVGLFTIAFEKLVKPMMGGKTDEAKVKDAQVEVDRYAPVLNAHLEGKEWILGKSFSIADICLATSVDFSINMAKIDLSQYKHIGAWLSRIQARDSWKK
jgi:glutathione S-transferase